MKNEIFFTLHCHSTVFLNYGGRDLIKGSIGIFYCTTIHLKRKTLTGGDGFVCMNTRCQCTSLWGDGWEVVWIVEFISAIVEGFRLIFHITLSFSVSPDLYEGQGWVRNPQCQQIFYGLKSYFEFVTYSTTRSITTKVRDDFGIPT